MTVLAPQIPITTYLWLRIRRRHAATVGLIAAVGAAGALIGPQVYKSIGTTVPIAPSGTANAWVANAGTCVWHVIPATYVAGEGCSTQDAAYHAAPASGGIVKTPCGITLAQQKFTTPSPTKTGPLVFQPDTTRCSTIQATTSIPTVDMNGQNYITEDGWNLNSYQSAGGTDYTVVNDGPAGIGALQATHDAITNSYINRGKLNGGSRLINLHLAQFWDILYNTIGPTCCGLSIPGSPVAVSIGKPYNSASADCTNEPCHINANYNTFLGADLRDPTQWPAGFGSAPEALCNVGACHADPVQIFGGQFINVNFNKFIANACTGVEIQPSGQIGRNDINSNINAIGNAFTAFATPCNGNISLDCHGAATCSGTFNFCFNEGPWQTILSGWSGALAGTVVNYCGNYGQLYVVDQSTLNNGGCTDASAPGISNVTLNYDWNVFLPTTPTGPCGTHATTGSTPGWVNASAAPTIGDMHKTGALGVADAYVNCALLTLIACPSSDIDGVPLPAMAAAGAYQRPVTRTGASLATCAGTCTVGTAVGYNITVPDSNGSDAKNVTSPTWYIQRPNNLTNSPSNLVPLLIIFATPGDPDTAGFRNLSATNKYDILILPNTHNINSPSGFAYASSTTAPSIANYPAGLKTCGISGTNTCDDNPWFQKVLQRIDCVGVSPCENIDPSKVYAVGGSKSGTAALDAVCSTLTSSYIKGISVASTAMISPSFSNDQTAAANCPAILGTSNGIGGAAGLPANTDVSIQFMFGDNDSVFCSTFGVSCLNTGYLDGQGRWHWGDPQLAGDTTPPSPSSPSGTSVMFGSRLGCSGVPTTNTNYGPTPLLHKKIYTGCTNSRRATSTILVNTGGHSYPGLDGRDGFDSATEAWAFFTAYGG